MLRCRFTEESQRMSQGWRLIIKKNSSCDLGRVREKEFINVREGAVYMYICMYMYKSTYVYCMYM